jgi:hypothetical protein
VVYFGGFFAKLKHFAGFSLHIINFVGRISEAAMKGVGELYKIYFITLEPSGRVHPHTWIFRGLFLYYSLQGSSAKLRWVGCRVGGHNKINMTVRELYYTFADFFQNRISLYNIIFAERKIEAAMGGGGYFLGCSVAQLGSSVAQ